MSGVKGLLARFENANLAAASAPPERGRSPAESLGAGSNATSPRPLSKVRTSFVTVESKTGQIGLKRDTSGEPSVTKRRTSFSLDEEKPKPVLERKQSYAEEQQAKKDSKATETIPEVAVEMEEPEPEPVTRGRELAKRREVVKPKEEVKAPVVVTKEASSTNGASKPVVAKEKEKEKEKEPVPKASSSRSTTKPAPISTAKTTIAPKHSPKKAKSPLPKTPTTPKSVQPLKAAEKQPEKRPARASSANTQTKTPTKPTTSAAHAGAFKTRIGASPPQSGFVKPKPRSPTRPIKLPASLTAHTASSGSKTAVAPSQRTESRHSYSRASAHPPQVTNSLRTQQTISRSPSRVSTVSTKTTPSNRTSSTLNKTTSSRPSIGPPPSQLKKQPSRQSLPAAPADESFLARMMRSTASSASKTAEKGPVTPPKAAQPVKKPVAKTDPPKVNLPTREKKVVAKAGPSVAKAKEVVGDAAKAIKSTVKGPVEGKKESSAKEASESKKPESKEIVETPEPAAVAPIAKDDTSTKEEKLLASDAKDEESVPLEEVSKEKEVEIPSLVEPEVESEPEFNPAESVDENVTSEIAAADSEPVVSEPIVETKKSEEEQVIPEPVVEAKEEVKQPEPIVESTKLETELPSPVKEKTIPIPESATPPTASESKSNTTEADEVPVTEVKTKSPVLNFFGEHADMWGRKAAPVTIVKPKVEDADDIKAREEIAKLNEALMAGAIESGEQAKRRNSDDDVE